MRRQRPCELIDLIHSRRRREEKDAAGWTRETRKSGGGENNNSWKMSRTNETNRFPWRTIPASWIAMNPSSGMSSSYPALGRKRMNAYPSSWLKTWQIGWGRLNKNKENKQRIGEGEGKKRVINNKSNLWVVRGPEPDRSTEQYENKPIRLCLERGVLFPFSDWF